MAAPLARPDGLHDRLDIGADLLAVPISVTSLRFTDQLAFTRVGHVGSVLRPLARNSLFLWLRGQAVGCARTRFTGDLVKVDSPPCPRWIKRCPGDATRPQVLFLIAWLRAGMGQLRPDVAPGATGSKAPTPDLPASPRNREIRPFPSFGAAYEIEVQVRLRPQRTGRSLRTMLDLMAEFYRVMFIR